MTADTTQASRTAPRSDRPRLALRLGFNARVSFNSGPGGARRGLRDGLALTTGLLIGGPRRWT
jgi:hypothetical protein